MSYLQREKSTTEHEKQRLNYCDEQWEKQNDRARENYFYFSVSIVSVHLLEAEIVLFCIWYDATNSRSSVCAKNNTFS